VVRTLISTLESLVPLIVHTRGMDQCISHSRGQDRLSMTNMTHRWWAREGGLFFDLFRLGYGCAALKKMWEHSFVCVCVCVKPTPPFLDRSSNKEVHIFNLRKTVYYITHLSGMIDL
jgi:hypothetical protein